MDAMRPHGGPTLAAIALSHDGRRLHLAHVTPSPAPRQPVVITSWDLASGTRVGRHESPPVESPRLVALGAADVLLVHHDGALRIGVGAARPIEAAYDLVWSPPVADAAGRSIVIVSRREPDTLVRIDAASGEVRRVHGPVRGAFAISPNGAWIAFGVRAPEVVDGLRVRVVEARTGRTHAESEPVSSPMPLGAGMVVDDSGTMVAWTSMSAVHLLRVGQRPIAIGGALRGRPALAFASPGADGRPRVLRAITQDILGQSSSFDLERGQTIESRSLGFLRAWALSSDGRVEVHGTDAGLVVRDLEAPAPTAEPRGGGVERGGDVSAVAFTDGAGCAVTGTRAHGALTIWSTSGQRIASVDTGARGIRALHARDDGASLVFVGIDGALGLCRPRERQIQRWPTPFVYASELALEPGGRRAFCVHGLVDGLRGKSYGKSLPREKQDVSTVWDVERGALLATLDAVPQLAQSAAWLADGSGWISLAIGTAVHRVALPAGTRGPVAQFPLDWLVDSPPPRLLPGGFAALTTVAGALVVYDLQAARVRATLGQAAGAAVLAVDARGERCVLRTAGAGTCVARLNDGAVVTRLDARVAGDPIAFAAFGPRTGALAVVTEGQTLRVHTI